MSDQAKAEPENPPNSEAGPGGNEAQAELAGKDVLTMLRRATELAGGNSRYAVDIAQKMSDQLWTAQKQVAALQARVTKLEADVQMYREKSERAELWLGKISSEIQERVLGKDSQS